MDYSIIEIRKAFFKTFHKSGELYFDYISSEEHCLECTENFYEEFEENLKNKE